MEQLTQRLIYKDKTILTPHNTAITIRNLCIAACILVYLLIIFFTFKFPISYGLLSIVFLFGMFIIFLIKNMSKTWVSCSLKSDVLIFKKLNNGFLIVPIYSVNTVTTCNRLFFKITKTEFNLDGRRQKVNIIHTNKSKEKIANKIIAFKEEIKKANL